MKGAMKYFILISFIFFAIALFKADYLKIPKINSFSDLAISLFFLFSGFIVNCFAWIATLRHGNLNIKIKSGIASHGLSVFGKYMPGKIWAILGRAQYLAENEKYSLKTTSALSLNAQFISLWTGLVTGSMGIIILNGFKIYGISVIIILIILSLIIFTRTIHTFIKKACKLLLKKEINIPSLSFSEAIAVLPWFFAYWILWCIAFYFMSQSIMDIKVPFVSSLGFGLAVPVGMIAVIFPAGIGVREGIIAGYLCLAGLDMADAVTISLTCRLWFLAGEIFIFLMAIIMHRRLITKII